MKAIEYFAQSAFGAWSKTGYLFENGFFICEFTYYNSPRYICRKYDFNFPPEKMTWGKNVIDIYSESEDPGAFADYQIFQKKLNIELDFNQMKNDILLRGVEFWNENHHSSVKL